MNKLFQSLSVPLGLLVGLAACRREPAAEPTVPAPFRLELLQSAASAAAAFPLDPHVKTRSRLQQQVVEACLEIGAVELAAERVEQAFLFAWWRRTCPHRGAGPVAPAALLANLASLWRVYGEPRGIAAHGLALLAAAFPAQSARELCPQCWARI